MKFCHQVLRDMELSLYSKELPNLRVEAFAGSADSGFRTKGLKIAREFPLLSPKCSQLEMKGYSSCSWKLNDEVMILQEKIHFTLV